MGGADLPMKRQVNSVFSTALIYNNKFNSSVSLPYTLIIYAVPKSNS